MLLLNTCFLQRTVELFTFRYDSNVLSSKTKKICSNANVMHMATPIFLNWLMKKYFDNIQNFFIIYNTICHYCSFVFHVIVAAAYKLDVKQQNYCAARCYTTSINIFHCIIHYNNLIFFKQSTSNFCTSALACKHSSSQCCEIKTDY